MIEPTDEMVQAFGRIWREQFQFGSASQAEASRAGLAAVLAIVERDLIARVEGARGEGLCTCSDADDPPINPRTGLAMEHHCDCDAVTAAGLLAGDRRRARHVAECVCDWDTP